MRNGYISGNDQIMDRITSVCIWLCSIQARYIYLLKGKQQKIVLGNKAEMEDYENVAVNTQIPVKLKIKPLYKESLDRNFLQMMEFLLKKINKNIILRTSKYKPRNYTRFLPETITIRYFSKSHSSCTVQTLYQHVPKGIKAK